MRVDPKNIGEIYENIPTWDNGTWTHTSFKSREEFVVLLEDEYFKEPGEYNFDDSVKIFRSEAIKFDNQGYYCEFLEDTLDFEDYWDDQALKSRKGIFVWNGDNKWYLPREYYFWLNFLPIIDKIKKKRQFPSIWDTQLWMSMYEFIAELRYKHAVILKKRQFGSSFYHVAKLINYMWFEDSPVLKIGASLDAYLTGVNGSWKFANMYRSFLNKETAWTRQMNPGTIGEWTQKQEVTEGGRKYDVGLMGTLQSISFQQSDTAGVGGLTSIFFYEEAGIAPRMDKTLEFLLPAMEAGDITTGLFIAAGTVGDLDQCKPLKTYIYKAKANNFQTIRNKWVNWKETIQETGMFVPEHYSMPPFIDNYGNSMVEDAKTRLLELYSEWERDLEPEICQIRKSQRPINMQVAFAARGESRFPLALIESHKLDVDDGDYPYELLELERDNRDSIIATSTTKPPITEFPINKKATDKSGSIVVFERPDESPDWGTYYASVDPVAEGKTTASDSLCSIYVYKNPVQVTRYDKGKTLTHVEGDKVVCSWSGRFDDINKTHERLELIIEWYNAWTLVEVNVSLFVVHMIGQRKQKYLVPKNEMVFLKEHGFNKGTHHEFGWKNTGDLFVKNILTYLIEFLKEKIHVETDEEGTVTKVIYGITRIPDTMALEEMKQYEYGLNVDRLIALASLIAFVKLQNANKGYKKRFETEDKEYLQKSDEIYKLSSKSPFKHMGRNGSNKSQKPIRKPFKNIR
tara:strand:- start:31842 stop:34070 length:2229 start_codon:yes stop_codon:yes gene_type:complete